MRWSPIAHKEFDVLIRSRGLWIFGLVFLAGYYLSLEPPSYVEQALGSDIVIAAFQNPVRFLVPLAAILVSYRSIAGERESGSIKFVAGMPQTRGEILLGKVVGRSAAVGVFVVGVFGAGSIIGGLQYGVFSPVTFILFLLATEIYVVVNVSVATGLSATVKRSVRAGTAVFVYYLVFILLWSDFISNRIYTLFTGTPVDPFTPPPSTALFLWRRIAPITSYDVITNAILGVGNSDGIYTSVIFQLNEIGFTNVFVISYTFDHPVPFYLSEPFSLVILATWIIIPLALGYRWFNGADLGGSSQSTRLRGWTRGGNSSRWFLRAFVGGRTVGSLSLIGQRARSVWHRTVPHERFQLPNRERYLTQWLPLAYKEFTTVIRSPGLWLLFILLGLSGYLNTTPPAYVFDAIGSNVAIAAFQVPVGILVPFAAILVSYRAITGERESGSIKFVAGMPQTRSVILLEKILGRTAAVSVFVFGAFCLVVVSKASEIGLVSPITFVFFSLASLLYVGINITLATAISAIMTRSVQAAAVVFRYFIIFITPIWGIIYPLIYRLITHIRLDPTEQPPSRGGLFLLRRLSPADSYRVITNAVVGVGNSDEPYSRVISELRPDNPGGYIVGEVFAQPHPYYLSESFALLILLIWAIVPLVIGHLVFKRTDLG